MAFRTSWSFLAFRQNPIGLLGTAIVMFSSVAVSAFVGRCNSCGCGTFRFAAAQRVWGHWLPSTTDNLFHARGGGALVIGRGLTTPSCGVILQAASETPTMETFNPKDEFEQQEEAFYRESLKMSLPLYDFGGLQYWKTTPSTTTTTTDNDNSSDVGVDDRGKFRVLFVLGGPGAGKGTQSSLLVENYPQVVHLSVGELLRQEEQSPIGSPHQTLIREALVSGKIVPVQVSLGLLQRAMEDISLKSSSSSRRDDTIFLVDGFPRNKDNLSGWCHYMQDVASIWSVLYYTCPLQVLEKRILERGKSSGRSDDNMDSLRRRFRTFESDTLPIIRKLEKMVNVIEIAGDQPLEDVWRSTQENLNLYVLRHDVLTVNANLLEAIERGDTSAYQTLTDPSWFPDDGTDPATILEKQEGRPTTKIVVRDAHVEFVSGQQALVSYIRAMDGQNIREKRIWVYQDGWKNVHFVRTPIEQ